MTMQHNVERVDDQALGRLFMTYRALGGSIASP